MSGGSQQKAFELLKQATLQPPVLKMADFDKPFIVQTDASGVALSAVLSQMVDGVRQPIAYASRTLCMENYIEGTIFGESYRVYNEWRLI